MSAPQDMVEVLDRTDREASSTSLAQRSQQTGIAEVTDATVGALLDWVVTANPEDVCWRTTELKSVRNWLAAHKAAKDLRIKAVRLELVALRKVGLAGLSERLPGGGQARSAAEWLAGCSDEQFDELLEDVSATSTPIGLFRKFRAGETAVDRWGVGRRYYSDAPYERDETPVSDDRWQRVAEAANTVLDSLEAESEICTVDDAASELQGVLQREAREWVDFPVPPLRDVIRHAMAVSSRPGEWILGNGLAAKVPRFVTWYSHSEGEPMRVPFAVANIDQLRAMVQLRRDKAEQAVRAAERLGHLHELLAGCPDDDADLETRFQWAVSEGLISGTEHLPAGVRAQPEGSPEVPARGSDK